MSDKILKFIDVIPSKGTITPGTSLNVLGGVINPGESGRCYKSRRIGHCKDHLMGQSRRHMEASPLSGSSFRSKRT